jgi:ATP-binding cassette subfamily B protein
LLLPLFVIPSIVTGAKVERMRRQTMEEHESDWRHVYDLNTLATSPAAGKEIRIFGLADEIHRRHVETMRDIRRWSLAIGMSDAKLTSAARSVFTLGYVGAIALVAWRVGTHQAPVSQLVLTVVLAGQVMGMLASLTGEAREFAWNIASVRRYVWFLDYAKEHKARHGGIAAPASLSSGITFESIDFTYPGTTNPVLTDVNLDIAPGSIVAIVGDNGAGKTTLVKLLSRLYQPSSGRITVDGTDLADYDIESWRARFGAAFQDHARLELVAQRAIGVGDMPHLDDTKAATEALQRAAAHNVLNDLPQRLETQLGTSWMDGVELSGGQWQKIALGRGMMRETPLVLVLDEPTAALDAETEHRLFERYARAAGEAGARAGTITVLVSHRFSTVRMADVIVVIDGGHIVETGGHDELVRRGGLYAQLYELQARAYR